jgi:hypothetical protein
VRLIWVREVKHRHGMFHNVSYADPLQAKIGSDKRTYRNL